MIRNNIKFVKLTAVHGERMHPIWFRVDLITRIAVGFDKLTHIDYLVNGVGVEADDFRVLETPEEIIVEIEKTNNN